MTRLQALRRYLSPPWRGQALVFFALASIVLMGALGLALDGGYTYSQRRAMQNAADAAALAGAKALQGNNAVGFEVWPTVQEVARQNGVRDPDDPAQLTCVFLDKNLNVVSKSAVPSDDNAQDNTALECKDRKKPFPVGADVSAVRVRAAESHATFVMRVLGNPTSGSSARATAQIMKLDSYPNNLALFIPCGAGGKVVDANGNIIKDASGNPVLVRMLVTVPPAPASSQLTYADGTGPFLGVTQESPQIADSAYAFDWNQPSTLGLPPPGYNLNAGPRFLIHKGSGSEAQGIERCSADAASFKGYNGNSTGMITIKPNFLDLQGSYVYNSDNPNDLRYCEFCGPSSTSKAIGPLSNTPNYEYGEGGLVQAGQGNQVGPASNVPGAGGCPANQDPDKCILILPVVDDSVKGTNGGGNNNVLAVRKLEAFYITRTSNGNEHYGQLVKNYPIKYTGTPGWTPGYTGTIVIKLRLIE